MIRRLAVRVAAWAFRHGAEYAQVEDALDMAFRHRSWEWRRDVIYDANCRNKDRAAIAN